MNIYTPNGQWQAVPSFKQSFDITDGMSLFANVKNCNDTKANAKLIAAAPELLAALEGFLNALCHLEKNNIPNNLWLYAENAINKATK